MWQVERFDCGGLWLNKRIVYIGVRSGRKKYNWKQIK